MVVRGESLFFLQISDNGYVTLDAPVLSTFPKSFPITSGSYRAQKSTMIAPYWSDVDTRCGRPRDPARIDYRQLYVLQGSDLYNEIQRDVSLVAGPKGVVFNPTSVVIVTWEAVRSSDCDNKVLNPGYKT